VVLAARSMPLPDAENVTTTGEVLLTKVPVSVPTIELPGDPLESFRIVTVNLPFASVTVFINCTSTLFRVYPRLLLPVVNAWAWSSPKDPIAPLLCPILLTSTCAAAPVVTPASSGRQIRAGNRPRRRRRAAEDSGSDRRGGVQRYVRTNPVTDIPDCRCQHSLRTPRQSHNRTSLQAERAGKLCFLHRFIETLNVLGLILTAQASWLKFDSNTDLSARMKDSSRFVFSIP